ncbi:hypothetical protein N836_10470 [Leptolyngbya sp. Heron Island J]|uniref:hypothetical protein n=1 Tax=Leptolyngbya sp. Heron Island J TaxID=1385935 RepID=UPI0003B958F8|nr:hypothetical protein [Leptolyngbya sp. Heron Island J]ESA35754.1 hypothetical protein N836_10470 [Leptolyngbya sp. Heron Island J]
MLTLKSFGRKYGVKPSDKRYILVWPLSAMVKNRALTIALHQVAYGHVAHHPPQMAFASLSLTFRRSACMGVCWPAVGDYQTNF